MRAVVIGVVIVAGLFVLRLVVGLGSAWLHYSSTPSFASYLRDHPVDDATIVAQRPATPVLASGREWSIGTASSDLFAPASASPDHAAGEVRFEVDMDHGELPTLRLRQRMSVGIDKGVAVAFAIRTDVLESAADMHALVFVSVPPEQEIVGMQPIRLRAYVDVFLLSGDGADRVQIVEMPQGMPYMENTELDRVAWLLRGLVGIVHPLGSPPAEGLIYHVRQGCAFPSGVGQGASLGQVEFATNTGEYSYSLRVKASSRTLSTTNSWHQTWTWNDETW